jgi:hypothetical protein
MNMGEKGTGHISCQTKNINEWVKVELLPLKQIGLSASHISNFTYLCLCNYAFISIYLLKGYEEKDVARRYFKILLGGTVENKITKPVIKLRSESGICQIEAGMLTNI